MGADREWGGDGLGTARENNGSVGRAAELKWAATRPQLAGWREWVKVTAAGGEKEKKQWVEEEQSGGRKSNIGRESEQTVKRRQVRSGHGCTG